VTDEKGNPVKEKSLPSRRWMKYQATLEKARHKRQEQTKTYVYTLAHQICKNYDIIGMGNYAPQGEGITKAMRRAMNNRSLIGRFKEALKWVAVKSGKLFIEYDEKGTTRTCNRCHYIHPEGLDPSIRSWICPSCQVVHIRDENAATNGIKKILRDLVEKGKTTVLQVPCSGLFQVVERWAWCVLPSGVCKTLRGLNGEQSQAPGNQIGSLIASNHKLALIDQL
jgi:putative transposase